MLRDRVGVDTPSICKLVDRAQSIAAFASQLVDIGKREALKLAMPSRRSFSWLTTGKIATTESIEQPSNSGESSRALPLGALSSFNIARRRSGPKITSLVFGAE